VSDAGMSACGHCGFPAIASAEEIAKAKGEPSPVKEGYGSLLKGFGWIAVFVPWTWNC
jgi:hypothetical protein